MKRSLFEFLPLTWLQAYRQTKAWFLAGRDRVPIERRTLREQFRAHWITILASGALLAGTVAADLLSGPQLTMAPFYVIPPAVLVLIMGRGWGTVAALLSAVAWSLFQSLDPERLRVGTVLWNSVMRFLLLEFIVLLVARVRCEWGSTETKPAEPTATMTPAAKITAAAKKSTRSLKTAGT